MFAPAAMKQKPASAAAATSRGAGRDRIVAAADHPLEQAASRAAAHVLAQPAAAPSRPIDRSSENGPMPPAGPFGRWDLSRVDLTAPAPRPAGLSFGSGGQALPPAARAFMEPRFGADFRDVRIHRGPDADAATNAIQARAYTQGQDIVVASDQNLETGDGRALLAHELAHTLQGPENAALIRRQPRSPDELRKQLADVQKQLATGAFVRSPDETARLQAEAQVLEAQLRQGSVALLQAELDANRHQQSTGTGVRSPEAQAQLKEKENELMMRIGIASGAAVQAPTLIKPSPGQPFIDWSAGNQRGLAAEGQLLASTYKGATRTPPGMPGYDFVQGGTRTPLTGYGRGQAGKLPLSEDSVMIDGGTLIQLKTLKNLDPSYQQPNALFNQLSQGMQKLANVKAGAGKSEQVGNTYFRIEHSGQAQRKIFHVELEAPPTPDQLAQINRLKEAGKSFENFGPGEAIEVVVNWPQAGPKPYFKVTSEGVTGAVSLGVAVAGMYGREQLRERQQKEEGYAPVGMAAHQGDGFLVRLGAFLRGDGAESSLGSPSLPDIPVWRKRIRETANGKKSGETLQFTWQTPDPSTVLHATVDVLVTYQKQADGSWRVQSVDHAPAGFKTPDLTRIVDPGVADATIKDMLSGPSA